MTSRCARCRIISPDRDVSEGWHSVSVIDIAKDFSTFPAGLFTTDGPFSGEAFREQLLLPRMRSGTVDIVLDGAHGLPTSFLEEAFGGLVRERVFTGRSAEEDARGRDYDDTRF